MGSGDQTNAAEAMQAAMESWSEDAEETVVFDTFICDNGEEIPADYVNDGADDCADGSDEGVDEEELVTELMEKAMNIGREKIYLSSGIPQRINYQCNGLMSFLGKGLKNIMPTCQ